MRPQTEATRRRLRTTRRRRFAYLAMFLVLSSFASANPRGPQDETVRINKRQARLLRDAGGRLRVVESLQIAVLAAGDSLETAASTPLVQLQGAAAEVRGLGGDLRPGLLWYEPPDVSLATPSVTGPLEVAFTYVLPDSQRVAFVSNLPVDSLIVEIQRGSVTARADDRLVKTGEGGPAERPYRIYAAGSIEPGEAIEVEIIRSGTGWRERFAVLVVTGAAAVAALLWLRRGVAGTRVTAGPEIDPNERSVGSAGQEP